MLDLTRPELRLADLARGMGVRASRVETVESFTRAIRSALAEHGPCLIELALGQTA